LQPRPDRLWGPTESLIQWVQGVKRPGHEADHSPTSCAEVNAWSHTSILPVSDHSMVLNSVRDKFS